MKVIDQRLRAGVRPDDGPGLQRDHAVGHEHRPRARRSYRFRRKDFSAFPFFFHGSRRTDARQAATRRSTPTPPTSAARSSRTSCTSTPASSTPAATCRRTASSPSSPAIAAAHRPDAAAEPACPADADGAVLHRQGRLPAQQRRNRLTRALHPVPQRLARTTSARGGNAERHRAGDRLPRRDGLDRRRSWCRASAARTAERVPRPVRAPAPEPRDQRRCRAPGRRVTITGVANFGGPYRHGQDAGFDFKQNIWQVIDNFTVLTRQPQLQDRASTSSTSTTSARRRRQLALHVPDASTPTWRRRTARTRAATRRSRSSSGDPSFDMNTNAVQRVRAGRLAGHADRQDALRRALRPLRLPGRPTRTRRSRTRRRSTSTRTTSGRALGVAWTLDATRPCSARAPGIMYDQPLLGGLREGDRS